MSIQPVRPSSLSTSDFSPPPQPVEPSSGSSAGSRSGNNSGPGANNGTDNGDEANNRAEANIGPDSAGGRRGEPSVENEGRGRQASRGGSGAGQAGRSNDGGRPTPERAPEIDYTEEDESTSKSEGGEGAQDLSSEEQRKVRELRRTDRKVRAHEQAHLAAGGQYVRGGPSFEYQKGPDGKRYAVGGEVQLDTSKGNSPRETLQKMRQVKSAALAPGNPSPKDQQMAQQAARKMADARVKMNQGGAGEEDGENSAQNSGVDPNQGGSPEQSSIDLGQAGENAQPESPFQVGQTDDSGQDDESGGTGIPGYGGNQNESQARPSGQVLNLLV